MWSVFDPDCGMDFYDTEQEAMERAAAIIDSYREDATEGWDELVENVVVAKVVARATKTVLARKVECSEDEWSEKVSTMLFYDATWCDEIWDYSLEAV